MRAGRFLSLTALVLLGFLPAACDRSNSSSSSSSDPIETNFGLSLKAVIDSEGVPDSVVAVVSEDGVATDTLRLSASSRDEAGVLRFPLEAPEGAKLSLNYRVYKSGSAVALGQVSWVSGEAPYSQKPNLAPRLWLDDPVDVVVRRGIPFTLRATSKDPDDGHVLKAFLVDWTGDGTMDDSVAPPKGRDSILFTWNTAGKYRVSARVRDDMGLEREDALSVLVAPVAKIAISQDTTISVGDTVSVLVSMSYDDPAQSSSTRLFWNIAGDTGTTGMMGGRQVSWSDTGTYRVVVSAIDTAGEASRDTMRVHVVRDVPKLDLGDFPGLVNLGSVSTLPFEVEQSYGTVVRWGMDFDGDTTGGWDTVGTGSVSSVQHLFARSGEWKVQVFAEDDDGNRAVSSKVVTVGTDNNGAVLRLTVSKDTSVSVGDTVRLRFARSFPEGMESRSTIEWKTDDGISDTTGVVLARGFAWSAAGSRWIAWRVRTLVGSTLWDTVRAVVESDVPVLDLSSFPDEVGQNTVATFSPTVSQSFGAIVRWGMDFDGDTASGWDAMVSGRPGSMQRVFSTVGERTMLVFAEDDDGNRAVSGRTLFVTSLGSDVLLRRSGDTVRVSIGDTASVRFWENFPIGMKSRSRLEWRVDDASVETLSVDTARLFVWNEPGSHVVRTRVLSPAGTTSWDSSRIVVVRDAPVVDFSGLPDSVSVNASVSIALAATQEFGRIVSWAVDFDGDTTGRWDSAGTGSLPSLFQRVFPKTSDFTVLVKVRDDDGNAPVASRKLAVRSGGFGLLQKSGPGETTVSIHDTVAVRLSISAALSAQALTSRLEWRIDTAATEVQALAESRSFRWDDAGTHVIRFRATGTFGQTSWDSVVVHVVQGVPSITAVNRSGSGVGKTIVFSAVSDPVYGSIVKERWDFGNDGTWDDSSVIAGRAVEHVFATSATLSIRVQVQDDDGNVDDSVFAFAARNSSPRFGDVSFADTAVGVGISIRLRAAFSDSDGLPDLATLAYDWNHDGVWDTVRAISGMGSDELSHLWTVPGIKTVRLRLRDQSGDSAVDSASVRVLLDPPVIASLLPQKGSSVGRIGDTLWYVASVSDPSDPADLATATWIRDGMSDSVVSLRGRSEIDMLVPVFSRVVGPHSLKTVVADRVGNRDSASAAWRVEAAPPFAKTRLSDTILVTGDTAHLILDSLRTGRLGGSIASVSWAYKGETVWHAIPAAYQGMSLALTLPVFQPARRDSTWYVVVRVIQDNGEVAYDTARSDLLESFVDARDGVRYPVVTIGGAKWMGRNLRWTPDLVTTMQATCPAGEDCMAKGLKYSHPISLPGQWQDPSKQWMVSVCPEGWLIPSPKDWRGLDSSARAAIQGDGNISTLLRSRFGWFKIEGTQRDPLRFAALPAYVTGGVQAADWWGYDSSGYQQTPLVSTTLLPHSIPWSDLTGERHIRCIRNDEIILDSGWRRNNAVLSASSGVYVTIRAYVPDSVAPVSVAISVAGGETRVTASPSELRSQLGYQGLRIALPAPAAPGRNTYRIELEQLGVRASDSMRMVMLLMAGDGRSTVTRIGDQTWMAQDVRIDTVPVVWGSQYAPHYVPDVVFSGAAPAGGPSTAVRGLCPVDMHIPSPAEWNVLFDAVRADSLDPQTALRANVYSWSPWTGLPATIDHYGFGATPSGMLDGASELDGSYYWAADANGYSIVSLVDVAGSLAMGSPEPLSNVANRALSLRCVGD